MNTRYRTKSINGGNGLFPKTSSSLCGSQWRGKEHTCVRFLYKSRGFYFCINGTHFIGQWFFSGLPTTLQNERVGSFLPNTPSYFCLVASFFQETIAMFSGFASKVFRMGATTSKTLAQRTIASSRANFSHAGLTMFVCLGSEIMRPSPAASGVGRRSNDIFVGL